MKGKFITGILTLAVLLGLLLVPAVGVFAEPPAGQATYVLPAVVYVAPGAPFAVNVTIHNPHNINISTAAADLMWSGTSTLNVTAIDNLRWPTYLACSWDNATGEAWYAGGGSTTPGQPKWLNETDILHCTVHFVAGVTGVVAVNFTPLTENGETSLLDYELSNDVCNWTAGDMQNMTVIVGTPKLKVDRTGAGNVSIGGVIPSSYPNTTNRNWNDVVGLTAIADCGWGFVNWTGDVAAPTNPITTVTINTVGMDMGTLTKSVTANFVELPCHLNLSTCPPNSFDLSARFGNNTDNYTVVISNTGGHSLCWALGYPPSWSVGDTWNYWNTYDTVPNPSPPPSFLPYLPPYYKDWICPVNDTALTMTVVSESNCTYTAVADWPMADPQRSINHGYPVCLQDAVVVVNKCTLDYVSQLANLTVYLGPPPGMPTQALVTWNYAPYGVCYNHGWPYFLGKSWVYNITVVDVLHPMGVTTTAHAMVTAGPVNSPVGPETDCYVITHFLVTPTSPFMQQYWSDTARNFVFSWDGGTFDAPPVDVRILQSKTITGLPPPTCCINTPSWLSFNKTDGCVGRCSAESLKVTANASGLAPGVYNGSFCISACCCLGIEYKNIHVNFEVLPATTIDVIRNLPDDALQMDAEYPGDWFWVYVNFTAPVNQFNSIGLTDLAPAGWAVQTDKNWCDPVASWANPGPGNKAEYAWSGEDTGYAAGTPFSAKYKVTIPATANNGLNDWPNGDSSKAWAEYWFGPKGPYTSAVTGDWQKIVTIPGPVVGETRDVNAALLTTTLVVLSENPPEALDEPEDSDSSTAPDALYKVWADDTGQYWMEASKYCYFALDTNAMPPTRNVWHALYIDFGTTAKLAAGYALDFEGDYGLVPKACTMSYAMKSVNHWLFVPIDVSETPHPEWQLSLWKAMESVHSWQFPMGCNT